MLNIFASNVVAVVVVLGIMIIIHELGHFLAAKFFKVRVEVFSVGFGKRLFGFRRGETDYRLSAIPLGGYVKMTGENPTEGRTGDPAEFSSHPRWQRFIIAVAGPAANIMLAIALLTAVYMVRYERPHFLEEPATIGWVLEGSPAEHAGIRPGDRILRIEDVHNPTWEQVFPKTMLSPNQPLDVTIQRNGQVLNLAVVPKAVGVEQFGDPGWLPEAPIVVTAVEEGMPAYAAGLRPGDEVVGINGRPMRSMVALQNFMQENRSTPVEVAVVREGQERHFTIVPELRERQGEERYLIGFESAGQMRVDQLPFGAALAKSLETNKRYSKLIFELVGKMVQGKISLKQIEGPIGIARVSGQAARMEGWVPLIMLMALISLNLGIFNLFPIPILDGGVILLLMIESVMRRDISLRLKERIYQFSFVFLILFAAVVIYNDVAKIIVRNFQ